MNIFSAIKNINFNGLSETSACMMLEISQIGDYENDMDYHFSYNFQNNSHNDDIFAPFQLSESAGNGNTFSKALNIMAWINKNTVYDGASPLPPSLPNVIIDYALRKPDRTINCANRSILFCDALMSIGIFAIPIRLQNSTKSIKIAKTNTEIYCHWIAHVFLPEQNSWVAFDPSFNNYFVDRNNNKLDVISMAKLVKTNKSVFAVSKNVKSNNGLFCVLTGLMSISVLPGNSYELRSDWNNMYYLVPTKYVEKAKELIEIPEFTGQ